jgi:murein DD-endopeptidase MepM/ murein hydrolase activator NlpD
VSQRSHDARHRAVHKAPSKPRRLLAGLALPTSAAVALIFGAAGAAVATSPRGQSVAFDQDSAGMNSPQPATVETAALRARHLKEIEQDQAVVRASRARALAQDLAVVRATAVARGVERKNLAARAVEAKRAALIHSWRLPITNPVKTSGFGYRWGRLHAGEDFAVPVGTPLGSMSTGTVVYAGAMSGYGNMVDVRYWDGTVSRFGHMSSVSVRVGQHVAPGQVVGLSGNTGHSTGPHLHLEIHPRGGAAVDPLPWLASHHVAS